MEIVIYVLAGIAVVVTIGIAIKVILRSFMS